MRVSTGQAGANALGDWLRSQLDPAVKVKTKWDTQKLPPRGVVTVVPVGRRRREDVHAPFDVLQRQDLVHTGGPTPTTKLVMRLGGYIQPMQLDVWCSTYDERDELIDLLDDALTASPLKTLGAYAVEENLTADPVRDGILLRLRPQDGYEGFVDVLFDEPEIDDTPDAVQRSEFRATYFGTSRGDYTRVRIVPRLTRLSLQAAIYDSEINPSPLTLVTFSQNPTPPPPVLITHG